MPDFVIDTYEVLIFEKDLFTSIQYIMESHNYNNNKNITLFTLLSVEIYNFEKYKTENKELTF